MSKFKPGSESPAIPTLTSDATPPRVAVRERRPAAAKLSERSGIAAENELPIAKLEPLRIEDSSSSGALSVALGMTLLFIFFRFSFLHEIITAKLGIDLHILMIVGGLAVLAALLSGNLFIGLTHRILLAWFGFVLCMVFATFFSIWRGGSFGVLFPYLRTTFILVVLIPAVTQSAKSLSALVKVIGVAGLATILVGMTMSDFRTGRLELSGGDSIANSNDYAAIVILMLPAIAFLTLRQGSAILMKIIGCGAMALGCFLVLSTGSRGALISMGLSVLYVLKVGSGKLRVAILLGLPLVTLVAVPFLPSDASSRLATLFSKQSGVDSEADASQAQRTALLFESVRISLQHPILGVGPGTFQEYQALEAKASGERGMWHETHNSYTQVSSECGLPAFLIYVSAIVMTLIVFGRGRKSQDPDIREASAVLSLMLVSFIVCMFFLAQGYGFGFPVLGGIAIAIDRLLKREAALAPALA